MADFARSEHPAVQAQLDRLALLSPAGDRLGLERITELLDRLGRPQDALPPAFHVAGTNGKGSTCAFLRSALEAAGHSVHVFTSPHLVRFNERIRIAGRLVEDEPLAALLEEVIDADAGIDSSFFEVTAAAAFLAFARNPADAAVIEVGLGGRLDATNVIAAPAACGIAAIGLDHEQFLGSSLAGIAAEKAGIAKPGRPLVALAQSAEAETALIAAAAERGAILQLEGRDWSIDHSIVPVLPGAHQVRNANLAWQMLSSQQSVTIGRPQFDAGIAGTQWPARFQRLADGPLTQGVATWIDGAHNPDAAAALGDLLATRGKMHIVLGFLANKDAASIVDLLARHALSLTFVPVGGHEHHDPAALAARFGGRAAATLAEALGPLPAPRLIAGSLYLAGAALAANGEQPD
ncbi:glutamate ligase domain-containing protein [Sphingomonas sp.]|uniref:bifunctional folylpolyglutamate synthase/dihydrofolate synthase n=1 Tax=Sphingomonas sp. TaxID=28214 RepID=UPI00286E9CE5|nr:bifunctional folylpolyglutamate synthase/dihydrofolate synthase [Sphingomonas sp.]